MMSLEDLQNRIKEKEYNEKQTKCIKKLLAYRNMLEAKEDCQNFLPRVKQLVEKRSLFTRSMANVPTFFNYYTRRFEHFDGKWHFCWILDPSNQYSDYGACDGETFRRVYIKRTSSKDWIEDRGETELLYRDFIDQFVEFETEFENWIEDWLKKT